MRILFEGGVAQNKGYNKKEYINYDGVFVVTLILCNST